MVRFPRRRRIYLMRHGSVEYFAPDGTPLPSEGVGLSERGIAEARAAAAALASVSFDRIVTSGLPRTRATAELAAGGRGIEIEAVAELREIRPGRLRDLPDDDLQTIFTTSFDSVVPNSRFLGGESFADFSGRVLPAFEQVVGRPGWKEALVVLHGGVNRLVVAAALGLRIDPAAPLQLSGIEQDPACINVVDVDDHGALLVRLLNFTPLAPLKAGIERTTMEDLFVAYRGEA